VKKLFSILLLLIYLPAISGVSVDSFYCCGELSSVQFHLGTDAEASNSLKKSDTQKNHLNCCDHVVHSFKIQDAQQQSSAELALTIPVLQPALIPPSSTAFIQVVQKSDDANNAYLKSRPPLWGNLPLFIRDESFLIWKFSFSCWKGFLCINRRRTDGKYSFV